jgi:K+-sensing histidine kinase KdpD
VRASTQRSIGIGAVLLLLAIFLLGIVLEAPSEPGAILYAIPVVLIALAVGPAAGALAGVTAGVLFWVAARYHDQSFDVFEMGYRLVVLVFLGAFAGVLAARLAASERSRDAAEREAAEAQNRLARREELGRRAVELNDEVVQGLALSGYLLSAGDTEAAAASLRSTLTRAQRIVGDLIETGDLEPGALRRDEPADVD